MANPYYQDTGNPATGAFGSSSTMRAELALIEAGFDLLPTFTGNADKIIAVSASANSLVALATTGSGSAVRATSPTLVTPNIGTPSAGVLTNCTGLPVSTGLSGLSANMATFLGSASSASLAAAVTDETGSGALVFATSPTLVTPVLGTPTSGTLTNCTGLPVSSGISGLGTGVATFLATPSSANLAAAITNETGSGSLVFGTSPTITGGSHTGATSLTASSGSASTPMQATSNNATATLGLTDTGVNGCGIKLTGSGVTTPSKFIRVQSGNLEIVNDAYSNVVVAFSDTGNANFGSTIDQSVSVYSTRNLTGGAIVRGFFLNSNVQSDVTNATLGFDSRIGTQAAAFSTAIYHYFAGQLTFGAGSTVTNQVGFVANSSLVGGTNNYGFQSDIPAAANRWNFYASGTANNAFAGSLRIGSTVAPTVALDVTGSVSWSGTATGNGSSITSLNASNISSGTLAAGRVDVAGAYTWTGAHINNYSLPASTGIAALTSAPHGMETQASGSAGTAGAAVLTLHRPNSHAVFFGLDTDNKLKTGGWSLGAVAYKIYHEGEKPAISADVSGLGANVATFLGTPSSANLAAAITDETGSGALVFGTAPTLGGDANFTGRFGYFSGSGTGGSVTQATSKSTAVTLNRVTGEIVMNSAALAASTTVSFTLNNDKINSVMMVMIQPKSGGTLGAYQVWSDTPTAGGAVTINVRNITGGSLSEALVLQFVVIAGATA